MIARKDGAISASQSLEHEELISRIRRDMLVPEIY
jgi:hypothetical protein